MINKNYLYDELADLEKPKYTETTKYVNGTFCNCFFKPFESGVVATRYHETQKDAEGCCVWCGYQTVNQVKESHLEKIDFKNVDFFDMRKSDYNHKLRKLK